MATPVAQAVRTRRKRGARRYRLHTPREKLINSWRPALHRKKRSTNTYTETVSPLNNPQHRSTQFKLRFTTDTLLAKPPRPSRPRRREPCGRSGSAGLLGTRLRRLLGYTTTIKLVPRYSPYCFLLLRNPQRPLLVYTTCLATNHTPTLASFQQAAHHQTVAEKRLPPFSATKPPSLSGATDSQRSHATLLPASSTQRIRSSPSSK